MPMGLALVCAAKLCEVVHQCRNLGIREVKARHLIDAIQCVCDCRVAKPANITAGPGCGGFAVASGTEIEKQRLPIDGFRLRG